MAFKVVTEPTFTHTVKIRTPVDGGYDDETCKATYRVIDAEEADSYDLLTAAGSTAFLERVIVKLSDLTDAEGTPIEWNDKVRTTIYGQNYVRNCLARGYFDAMAGVKKGN